MGKIYRLRADADLAEKLEETYDFSEEEIDDFSMYYWKIIDNLVQYYDKYYELRCLHTEDLLLYAMMYRNVSIEHNDIFDKKFFADRENEIIGFKKKTFESNSVSIKAKVLDLYYKYGLYFESICYRLTGKKISILSKRTLLLNNSKHFENLVDGHLDIVFSINNLTESECDIILRNEDTLKHSYCNSDYIFDVFPICPTQPDFVENIIMPYYRMNSRKLEWRCFQKYILKKYYLNYNDIFKDVMKQIASDILKVENEIYMLSNFPWEYKNEEIERLKNEKERLDNELLSLRKIPFVRAAYLPSDNNPFRYYNDSAYRERIDKCEREADLALEKRERQEREYESKIEEIDRQIEQKRIEQIDILAQKRHQMIIAYTNYIFSTQASIQKLYDNQNELQAYCNHMYKLLYHRSLLYTPELCQKLLSLYSSNTDYLNAILSKRNPIWCWSAERWNIGLRSRKGKMNYEHKKIMREYKTVVESMLKQEYEQERIQREKEIESRKQEEEKRLEQYRFNIRNHHPRDQNVSFREADHIYIVDSTPLDSVTTFVKNCFPEFNADFHAKRKAEALGITKEEVLEMWDKKGRESREQGTEMHKKIEAYYLGKSVSKDETFDLFKIFANKITLRPYRTEWAVYDWEQKIAGTIDFVDYQNGEYIIYDWKRSDKLIAKNGLPIKNSLYGEKALPPIDNLDDSPYYHYALQLSLYKYILEKNYGITVSKLRLGIFHPSYNKPYVLEMPYLKNEIDTLFGLRSEVVF